MRKSKFGKEVRCLRESKGFGLRELAGKIGVSPTYLSRVEQDKEQPPSIERICKIAEVLEADKDQLLQWADKAIDYYTENLKNETKFVELLHQIATSPDRAETIDNLIKWSKADATAWTKYKE